LYISEELKYIFSWDVQNYNAKTIPECGIMTQMLKLRLTATHFKGTVSHTAVENFVMSVRVTHRT